MLLGIKRNIFSTENEYRKKNAIGRVIPFNQINLCSIKGNLILYRATY